MHFWLSASQTASFKRSVIYGSFSIALTKKMHIFMVCAWTHVSRYVSSQHDMVLHTIAKSRSTNLCFWMLLTKHFKSFTQSVHHVAPFQFHCISIFISNLAALFLPCNVLVLSPASFKLGLMTDIITEQQKSTTVAFAAYVNTEGFSPS